MQVRMMEFQENFGRIPLEGARQQSLMQRAPQLAQQAAAQVGSDEQILNLNRPRPTSQPEGSVVDPEGHLHPGAGRYSRRGDGGHRAGGGERRGGRPAGDGASGTRIDIVV